MLITNLSVLHEVLNGSESGLKLDKSEAAGFSENFLSEDFGFVHRALLLVVVLGVISFWKPRTNAIPKIFFFRPPLGGNKFTPRNFEKRLHNSFEHRLLLYA